MLSTEQLRVAAEHVIQSMDGAIPGDYRELVRTRVLQALPSLVERRNLNPRAKILMSTADATFGTAFSDVPDPERRHHLQLIAACICHDALRTLSDKPRRPIFDELPDEIREGMEKVDEIGKGSVFLGGAAALPGSKDYRRTQELAHEQSLLLGKPIWTGAGPGIMDAALRGGAEAGGKIGGIKINLIGKEQDVSPVLQPDAFTLHKRFPGRKIALIYAGTRDSQEERTAVMTMPGGFGTADEFYELLVLCQTGKSGSPWHLPFFIANYDGYFNKFLAWMREEAVLKGYAKHDDLDLFCVCDSNMQILEETADFYEIPEEDRTYRTRISGDSHRQRGLFNDIPLGFYKSRGINWRTKTEN